MTAWHHRTRDEREYWLIGGDSTHQLCWNGLVATCPSVRLLDSRLLQDIQIYIEYGDITIDVYAPPIMIQASKG